MLSDTALEARYNGEDVIIGDSPDGVKVRIDAMEAERAVQQLTARLKELEKHNGKA